MKMNHRIQVSEIPQLGKAIRDERKARHLTQTQLADIAGVSLNFVSQLESGKPRVQLDKVLAVMGALGLELQIVFASSLSKETKS